MKQLIGVIVFLLTACCITSFSYAVPIEVNYQGYLTDQNGVPIDGSTNLTYRLYDVDTGGTSLWDSGAVAVDVANGVYSVVLGDTSAGSTQPAIDPAIFVSQLWLGIEVATDGEMTPRQKLTSVPFALNAERLEGMNATEFLDKTTYDAGDDGTVDNADSAGTVIVPLNLAGASSVPLVESSNSGIGSGVAGKNTSSGNEGYLGSSAYGVYGTNTSSGNYGYLGSSGIGVAGYHQGSGNFGRLGDSSYGVYSGGDARVAGNLIVDGSITGESDPTVNDLGKSTLSCSNDQVAKWNGSVWACANDNDADTTYTAGTGIDLVGTTFNVEVPLSLAGTDNAGSIINGTNAGTSYAIYGVNSGSSNWGALGSGSYGIFGHNAGAGVAVYGRSMSGNGVYGYNQSNGGIGILGGPAYGVYGSGPGAGGYFTSSTGYGLLVDSGNVGIGTVTPNEQLEITGNLRLPSTTATTGIVKSGSSRLIHTYGSGNFFAGIDAGNLTMNGNYNTATGAAALSSNTSGSYNAAIGSFALESNTTGYDNIAMGDSTLNANTEGNNNTAIGSASLFNNTLGSYNSAHGSYALFNNTTANKNTAVGQSALFTQSYDNGGIEWDSHNTAVGFEALHLNQPISANDGIYNTAVGSLALRSNTEGLQNTAIGHQALYSNTSASGNTAVGDSALFSQSYDIGGVTSNTYNTAVGQAALYYNQPLSTGFGRYNTAVGAEALFYNNSGSQNTANGRLALYYNIAGTSNTAVGHTALYSSLGDDNTATGEAALYSNTTGEGNTAVGLIALYNNRTGSYNTAIGRSADVVGFDLTNATAIGFNAKVDVSNKVVIGNTEVTSIGGYASWSNYSDQRVKTDIEDIEYGIDLIKQLRPVSFKMKNGNGNTDFGFVAQDIEALLGVKYNLLDVGGGDDRMLSLRYTQFIAPMVRAMQQQQTIIEKQNEKIRTLEERLARLEALL